MDNKIISASYEASKTNESCMLFNKSEDYSVMGFISVVAILCLICFGISDEFECIPYCIATVIFCFILIYIMHKYKQNKINKFIKNNKSTLSDPDAGVTYVIRDKRILSDPDAKIYIDKSYSEEISIFYDQITEIKTGKILNAAELKQFLKAEESN